MTRQNAEESDYDAWSKSEAGMLAGWVEDPNAGDSYVAGRSFSPAVYARLAFEAGAASRQGEVDRLREAVRLYLWRVEDAAYKAPELRPDLMLRVALNELRQAFARE